MTINDGLGSNTIKFDYGVEITSFVETSSFFGISSIAMNLASGATITVTNPAQQGQYQYQFGDEAVMDYAAFKTALGVDIATGTLTTPFVVDYPSDDMPITYPDPIPDPVVDFSTYNHITGTNNSDSFNGTEDADRFYNLQSGRDHVRGNGGNDLIESGGAYDTFNGGSGSDTVSYANANSYVIAHLGEGRANIKNSGLGINERDTLISIENLIGSNFGDQLTGSDGKNQIEGGAGDDRLHGGFGGMNILYGGTGDDTLISASEANSHNTLIGGANADIFWIGQQNEVIDIIRDFTPDDGDEIQLLIGNGANKNSLDALLNDNYLNHQSTRFEDYTGNGKLDTVMKFNPNNSTTNPDHYYTLVLESFTAPLLIDYISVEVDS